LLGISQSAQTPILKAQAPEWACLNVAPVCCYARPLLKLPLRDADTLWVTGSHEVPSAGTFEQLNIGLTGSRRAVAA
jgi:hypothetical protein